jgi:hypothetical protein
MADGAPLREVDFAAGRRESIVRVLEAALERARGGDCMSVTVMIEAPTEVSLDYSGCDNLLDLLGKVTRLQHNLQKRMDGE